MIPRDPALQLVLERARGFVEDRGSRFESLRVAALMGEGDAVRALLHQLEALQEASGALTSLEEGGRPDVSSSAAALELLADLRLLALPCAERAARFLISEQRRDGSFEPRPGAGEELCLRFSGRLAATLAPMACVPLRVLDGLGGYLGERFSPERIGGGRFEDLAAFLPFFTLHPHELGDSALQWCGRELERGYRTRALAPLEAARLFLLCDARSLPAARLDASELVRVIRGRQAPDGGFGSCEDPPGSRLGETLESTLALVRLG
ncbi:MAG: prenyltransferase/squalene oxidase repeat-containing protein [Myxococcota bacterium]